jgi:hypothetical protein
MFGISPSDMQWWAWLIVAAIAAFLTIGSGVAAEGKKGGCMSYVLMFLFGLVALVCGVIGLIRFIKWAWEG